MAAVTDAPPRFHGRRVATAAAVIALLGFAVLGLGLALDPDRMWLSYLMAYAFVLTTSSGALILLQIGYAANARWMAVVRRLVEIVALPLPALIPLLVPLLFGLGRLYPWRAPPAGLTEPELRVLEHRAPYFELAFFLARAFAYLAVLVAASYLLRRWSVRRDAGAPLDPAADAEAALARERRFASGMLPPVALAFSFAVIDWIMSLAGAWYSSMFPVYVFAGGFLAALALVTVFARALWHRGATAALTRHHFHALGRMLFAFTVFWAYTAFFQAMLIQIADKPTEATFYLARIHGAWAVFVWILILGHFALPFLVLLLRAPKFRPGAMALAGGWLVLMHLVDVYWIVIPSHVQGAMVFHWLDLGALAAVVGTAVAVAAWRQHGVALIPPRDPFLGAGAAYRSSV